MPKIIVMRNAPDTHRVQCNENKKADWEKAGYSELDLSNTKEYWIGSRNRKTVFKIENKDKKASSEIKGNTEQILNNSSELKN